MEPVLLCTPNFSEGRNAAAVEAIVQAVASVPGVKVLAVDSGATVNRTVVAFGGAPGAVFQAARALYEAALKRIDMRQHQGVHPRIGAVDVCPFTPYRGVELSWLKAEVERFAQDIADSFRLPVYLYAQSARTEARRSLPALRKGGYEGLAERLKSPDWAPDYGPLVPNPRAGATVIGVRDYIAAFNLTLNTRSDAIAQRIARAVRASNGGLPYVQAMGWFLPELGFAQVSINILDLRAMPLHRVFEAVDEAARAQRVRITGTEIVGILPEWALLETGRHFLSSAGEAVDSVSAAELVQVAIRSLMLERFQPEDRLPEWVFGPAEPGADLGEFPLRELLWGLAERQSTLSPTLTVIVETAMALSLASRLAAGLPARNAFSHAEYMQLLQDVLLLLQKPKLDLEDLRFLGRKLLRGFALFRQMGEALALHNREEMLLLAQLFSGAVELLAAAYAPFQNQLPELAQERHDIQLQGRFFQEELLSRVRI